MIPVGFKYDFTENAWYVVYPLEFFHSKLLELSGLLIQDEEYMEDLQ